MTDSTTLNTVNVYGVLVDNYNSTTVHNIVIRNMYIHDVTGKVITDQNCTPWNNFDFWKSAGIMVKGKPQTDGVLIEENLLKRIHALGINYWPGVDNGGGVPLCPNVIIRNNMLDSISGDGIYENNTYQGLIDHNTLHCDGWDACLCANGIWGSDTRYLVIQYNEVYDFEGGATQCDGRAFGNQKDYGQIVQPIFRASEIRFFTNSVCLF